MLPSSILLRNDEHEMLRNNTFEINILTKKHGQWPTDWKRVFSCAGQVIALFVLALLMHVLPWYIAWVCLLSVLCILTLRIAMVLLLVVAARKAEWFKHMSFYRASLLYWMWWPTWSCLLCCVAATLGGLAGHRMWYNNLNPYFELARLQTYNDVLPGQTMGERVQDGGLISFGEYVDVDRDHGGCFVHSGHTYCVSPIVLEGRLPMGLSSPSDFFAVGIDCCQCPNKDFRCGDWQNPLAQGGIRSLDWRSRPFYRLAVDAWAAEFQKAADHPIFVDWVQDPVSQWKMMWNTFLYFTIIAVTYAISGGFLAGVLLEKVLTLLAIREIAYPRESMAAPPGTEQAWKVLFPEMYRRWQEAQALLVGLPATGVCGPGAGYGVAMPQHARAKRPRESPFPSIHKEDL